VEITKDIGAMMINGGYIVVGADDNGRPAGKVARLDLFELATVHAKEARYLPAGAAHIARIQVVTYSDLLGSAGRALRF
jgi:hypothetical protein